MWLAILIASKVKRQNFWRGCLICSPIQALFTIIVYYNMNNVGLQSANYQTYWVIFTFIGALLEGGFWWGTVALCRWFFIWRKQDAEAKKARNRLEIIVGDLKQS